jgi:phosphoketolase
VQLTQICHQCFEVILLQIDRHHPAIDHLAVGCNFHVRGYKEKGNINTPLELAILNQVDRFNLAIDVIDRVPTLQATAAHTKEWLKEQIIDCVNYAHENGIDRQQIREWKWPGEGSQA